MFREQPDPYGEAVRSRGSMVGCEVRQVDERGPWVTQNLVWYKDDCGRYCPWRVDPLGSSAVTGSNLTS